MIIDELSKSDLKPPSADQMWWRSPMTWILGLILLAGVAGVIAAASTRDTDDGPEQPETAFAEGIGAALPPLTSPDPAVGTAAPTLNAQTLAGDRVQLGGDGTARIYGFFAHWCPHCQEELPSAVEWLESNPLPDGVEIVAISSSVDPGAPNYPPSSWFDKEGWSETVLLDSTDQAMAQAFGLTAFPFWVAVDADGYVIERVAGSLTEDTFTGLVDRLAPAD